MFASITATLTAIATAFGKIADQRRQSIAAVHRVQKKHKTDPNEEE